MAVIILAPCRMMPCFSTTEPTMNPGTSARNSSGTLNASHSCTNRAAAHRLERRDLPGDHLDHEVGAEVQRGVALDQRDDVAERGDVGASGGGRAEQRAGLRDADAGAQLGVEDATRAAPAGEELDL